MREAGALIIRDATAADIPALARLHVTTWNDTHLGPGEQEPTYEIREWQWREAFKATDGSWFCFVIEGRNGELSKIYLLREYQRFGLGRRLLGHVARRFLGQGISSMLLFGVEGSPACRFYEALGGERLRSPEGESREGNYGWRDLRTLAAVCPIE